MPVSRFIRPVLEKVSASCLAADIVGKAVYATGPLVGDLYQVTTANPRDESKMPAFGVIIEKESPIATECVVLLVGEVRDLSGFTFTPRKLLFVGVDGSLSETPPTPLPSGYAFVQPLGFAISTDRAALNPSAAMTKRIN